MGYDKRYVDMIYTDWLLGNIADEEIRIPRNEQRETAIEMVKMALSIIGCSPVEFIDYANDEIMRKFKFGILKERDYLVGWKPTHFSSKSAKRLMSICFPVERSDESNEEYIVDTYNRLIAANERLDGTHFMGTTGVRNLQNLFLYWLNKAIIPELTSDNPLTELYDYFYNHTDEVKKKMEKKKIKNVYYNRYQKNGYILMLWELLPKRASEEDGSSVYSSSALFSYYDYCNAVKQLDEKKSKPKSKSKKNSPR